MLRTGLWLQAAVEEKARVAKEKELETARLRAKQERAADRQAEIDELRARRSAFLPASHSLAALPLLPLENQHPFTRCQELSNTLTDMQIIQNAKRLTLTEVQVI